MRACGALQIKAFPALNCPQQTSFSVHFLFSAACELWRRSPGSICPGWTSGRTHRRTPHSVSSPCPGKSPLPASCPAARPPSGTTCSRRRTKSSADRRRCRHRPAQGSFRPRSCSTPGVSGRWLVSSGRGYAVGGAVRPVFQRRQVLIGSFAHASLRFLWRVLFPRCLSIDELSQVYTFLTACAVYPRGRKSA